MIHNKDRALTFVQGERRNLWLASERGHCCWGVVCSTTVWWVWPSFCRGPPSNYCFLTINIVFIFLLLNQVEGRRKTATATVKVTKPGTGKLVIKHRDYPHIISDITYFFGLKERHVLLYPLQVQISLCHINLHTDKCQCLGDKNAWSCGHWSRSCWFRA